MKILKPKPVSKPAQEGEIMNQSEFVRELASERLGSVEILKRETSGGNEIVIADSWSENNPSERVVWICFEHSYNFENHPYEQKDGVCTSPLSGNETYGYQFVAQREASVSKIRRRLEDHLRKNDAVAIKMAIALEIDIYK